MTTGVNSGHDDDKVNISAKTSTSTSNMAVKMAAGGSR